MRKVLFAADSDRHGWLTVGQESGGNNINNINNNYII